eukprot:symbB.v1.2.028046.t1/scaffold2930.1/size66988/3
MAKDSWPNGVTSWDDTVKFARFVFGEKVSVEDYSHRLPRPSKRSFLLFAKGACGPGTPFHEIGELIEPHLEEVKQYELGYRRNNQRPEKSQQMLGSDNWTVHYWSTQLTRAPCTQMATMAGDFQSEFWHGVPERASWSVLQSRSMFDEMQVWEQRGLVDEIERHEKAVDGERHVRKNCTIRWHATHWENCPSQCHGNQVRSGVAVRKSDAAEAAGSSEIPVPTVSGTGFAGVKRSQDEAVCDELSSVKTTRSLDTASADMVRKLLELVESASNSQVYRPMMLGMKLVGSQALHDQNLPRVESTTLNLRKTLLHAQETVAGYGEKFAAKVSFADLDATALAAQQLRILHRHLGELWTKQGGGWLIETAIDPKQNRLNDHGKYSKCLMSHRVLELVLDALSLTEMQRHMEIAIDLKMLAKGTFPAKLQSLRSREKKKKEDMGCEWKQVPADSVVLVKGLDIGYVKQIAAGRRLLARESGLRSLLQAVDPANIIRATLQTTIRMALEHLRTLDVERQYCDRYDGTLVSANYDIWIWLWVVE